MTPHPTHMDVPACPQPTPRVWGMTNRECTQLSRKLGTGWRELVGHGFSTHRGDPGMRLVQDHQQERNMQGFGETFNQPGRNQGDSTPFP